MNLKETVETIWIASRSVFQFQWVANSECKKFELPIKKDQELAVTNWGSPSMAESSLLSFNGVDRFKSDCLWQNHAACRKQENQMWLRWRKDLQLLPQQQKFSWQLHGGAADLLANQSAQCSSWIAAACRTWAMSHAAADSFMHSPGKWWKLRVDFSPERIW